MAKPAMANPGDPERRIGGNELDRDEDIDGEAPAPGDISTAGVAASAAASLLIGCPQGAMVGRGGLALAFVSGLCGASWTIGGMRLAWEMPATAISGKGLNVVVESPRRGVDLRDDPRSDADVLTARAPAEDARPGCRTLGTWNGRNGEGAAGSSGGANTAARQVGHDCLSRNQYRAQSSVSWSLLQHTGHSQTGSLHRISSMQTAHCGISAASADNGTCSN